MATKEEKITEIAKLLASGAITTEEFTRIVSALNGDVAQNPKSKEKTTDTSISLLEKGYIRVMEGYAKDNLSPATSRYPPFSECEINDISCWNYLCDEIPCFKLILDDLRAIHSYIDGTNMYGGMLRDRVDIIIDDKQRIILSVRINDRDEDDIKKSITFQYPHEFSKVDDSIEAELYEKYLTDIGGETCAFIPFNKKMLCEADVPIQNVPENAGFFSTLTAKIVIGHVYFILTTVYISTIPRSAVIVLDSFSNFNLIRIFLARNVTISEGKVDVQSDGGKYLTWRLNDSPSTVKALAEAAEQMAAAQAAVAQAAEIDKPVDDPIQLLLEQVDYDKLESSYNAHMQNLIATTYKRYKDCSYPPFDKSMLTVSEGLKKKTYWYEIKTKILLSSSKKLPYSIYLKNLDTYEFGIFPTTIKS